MVTPRQCNRNFGSEVEALRVLSLCAVKTSVSVMVVTNTVLRGNVQF